MTGVERNRQRCDDNPQHIQTDGGVIGWFAVLGTFASWFTWIGILKALAVMLPTLQDQFDTHTWPVGWMIATFDGLVDISGPFASLIRDQFGVRAVVMVSGIMVCASFIASSLVSNLALMTLIFAGVAAPAVGIANILTRELIGQCFTTSYTRAFGIAASGASLAFVVFASLTQLFLDIYGWRGAMILIGAIFLHLTPCGALLKTNEYKVGYRAVPLSASGKNESIGWWCAKYRTVLSVVSNSLRLDLFRFLGYWLVVIIAVCTTTTGTAWMVYFPTNTNQSKGFSLADTATFVGIFGVGKITGNFIACLFDKCEAVGPNTWMTGAVIGSSFCFLLDPWMTSYWPIVVHAFIYGWFNSFIYTLFDVVTKDVVGADRLGSAIGWIGLKAGICRALFEFFPGLVYDTQGSYTVALFLMSGINALALPALIGLSWLRRP